MPREEAARLGDMPLEPRRRKRGASRPVRETAAWELEVPRADWRHPKAQDVVWNIAFVVVAAVMLVISAGERPDTPIRLWICGYALQCVVHAVLITLEYRRSNAMGPRSPEATAGTGNRTDDMDGVFAGWNFKSFRRLSFIQKCESVNSMASFLWWIVGSYWVISGGDALLQKAPRLYWSAVVLLAFDVFFACFVVFLACLIAIALYCCVRCIIAILYAFTKQFVREE